ncbi:MAG: DUF2303 family protein [Bryobacteraceae bacterium]|nr:DUF2303 family protein [Bryobacteraceae bacterium]
MRKDLPDSNESNWVEAALAAGAAHGEPRQAGSGLYAVVPDGYRLKSLEEFRERPARVRQQIQLNEADSFIAYVESFLDRDATRIFFDQERETFAAILDYHAGGQPGWCEHQAHYACRRSEEFKTWLGSNKTARSQVEFARFLEDNLPDIVEPPGAVLLEIALTLEAKKEVNFSSGVRLATGQIQFTYDEIVRGNSSTSTLEVPEQFVLGIPIHEGGPAYRIPARLRWRLKDGQAAFWYEIVRPHRFIQDALDEIRRRIEETTGIAILAGAAQPARA